MNKKSIVLFFSVLVLLSLGALYVFADLTGLTLTNAGDGYNVASWIRDTPSQVNLTVNATQLTGTGVVNITNITFTLNEANVTWDAIFPGVGEAENISSLDGTSGGLTNITYYPDGSAWPQWTCFNITDDAAGQIECYIADAEEGLGGRVGNESLVLTLNMTASATAREEVTNFSVKLSNCTATNETEVNLYIDTKSPRLIEVNISDGNTTYANSTWGTQYWLYNNAITITALIEDSQLASKVYLAYNCNSTNASITSEAMGGGGATEQELIVTDADAGVGTINHRGYVVSTTIDCSSPAPIDGNETLNFVFLANDTFNHKIVLNGTDTPDQLNSFWIGLDNGTLSPIIAKVNVTQTTESSISRTLNHGSELDGMNDYLAANTVTFDVELTGGEKPEQVIIAWNNTGAATTSLTSLGDGGAWVTENLDLSAALTASNISHTNVESGINESHVTVVYSTTLNLAGNASNNFVFWVYANNTGNNYTRLSGPHRFTVDGSGPSITMTPPTDRTISPSDSITYTCSATDTAGVSLIKWELKKPGADYTTIQDYTGLDAGSSDSITFSGSSQTSAAGTYTVRCSVKDAVGNVATKEGSGTTETFSVSYTTTIGGEDGSSGSSGGSADIDLSTTEETTITEKQGVISTFTLDGTTIHTIKIKTVDEVAGTVTIEISSDPITITLKIGETKEVDLDVDGTNDLSVTLNKITSGVADITTKRLTPLPTEAPAEEVPTEAPAEEIPTAPEAASKTWLWILIIVVIVVIGVGYWFMKKK